MEIDQYCNGYNTGKALTLKVTKGTIRQSRLCDIIYCCSYRTKPFCLEEIWQKLLM